VNVREFVDSIEPVTNLCEIESDRYYTGLVSADTNICCWTGDIIYVDADANGRKLGSSWLDAYSDLHTALAKAATSCGEEIWVADGTYLTTEQNTTFALTGDAAMYGGFAGGEGSRNDRDWLANESILSGEATTGAVVTASYLSDAIIDGFTIVDGGSGIYSNHSSVTIRHNRIEDNKTGIFCYGGDANVANCQIIDSELNGIHCQRGSSLELENSEIRDGGNGVYCDWVWTAAIRNTWVHHTSYGITFLDADSQFLVCNSTIVDNRDYGISSWWEDTVQVANCIVGGNDDGGFEAYGYYNVTYSCIEGGYSGEGNIDSDPCFIDDPNDPNDYHLWDPNAGCVDGGSNDAITDPNETDIDGEDRIIDGDSNGTATVDRGADEYYWSPADLHRDDEYLVNFLDFAIFAPAWQTSSGQLNYNDDCDLADNNAIDYNDLRVFCADWLWQAGWAQPFGAGLARGMAEGAEPGEGLSSSGPSLQQPVEPAEPDIEELIEWLEELWSEDDELSEMMSEDEWLKFLDKIKAES
jgi:hypothetical protein